MNKIAIIGAGIAGLTVARLLQNKAEVTLFEKSRGVSGRMSTRRSEPYFFDHGAQYFTIETSHFRDFMQPLINQGVVKPWEAKFVTLDKHQTLTVVSDNKQRYVGCPGMNAIGKYLAKGLDISLNTKITTIAKTHKWCLIDDSSKQYDDFDWVIITAPSPQAIALLPETFRYYTAIKAIDMQACFALMLGFSQPLAMAFDSAQIIDSDISWLAVNSSKPDRPEPFTLVAHSSQAYANAHIDTEHDKVMRHLCEVASHLLECDLAVAECQMLQGWRFANSTAAKSNAVLLDWEQQIAVCGDWCQGGRVEGAYTSAYELSQQLIKSIV